MRSNGKHGLQPQGKRIKMTTLHTRGNENARGRFAAPTEPGLEHDARHGQEIRR